MMGPIFLLVALACAVGGWASLRRSGRGWRVGRLLSAAPEHSLAEATAVATRREDTYVRLHARIDSDEEFPGDDDEPLVFRRRRLQRRVPRPIGSGGWQTFDDERLAVPFRLTQRDQRVAIEVDALADGLVVVPRVSIGVVADLSGEAAVGGLSELAPQTPVRLRLEQISTVDHATACGVPRLAITGETVLGPGRGRPLILTTLELDEAMRVLGSEQRGSLRVAAGLLAIGLLGIAIGLLLTIAGR